MFVRSRKAEAVSSEPHRTSTNDKLTNEVEEGQPWDEFEVELAKELLVLRAVSTAARVRSVIRHVRQRLALPH